ncbi:Erythromycin biosynthesis sensory transduction protein eryC1 [Beauveria bassiana D1-5]|uniref:Erythromycin biosynthesis sensory transduction protein eryC1 n=1 Tax=Beauveria bassiana D1-5 TaxID=1245745 RepID=A0A0A2VEC7_BEABA|nr:Erythromycin biosynthesis sensory transduction protein eryC1 [Beauveria bassiana D1-5]
MSTNATRNDRGKFGELRAGVIGLGKFGTFHANKYAAMPEATLVAVVDTSGGVAKKAAARFNCLALTDYRDLVGKVDIVSVTTPATAHVNAAIFCLGNGIDVYLEKPLSANLADARRIVDAAADNGRILQIGHQERFLTSHLWAGSIDIPTSIQCRRTSTEDGRCNDVHVALDLMVHDIDLVLQLIPGTIKLVFASGSRDAVSATVEFGGVPVNFYASRIAVKQERWTKVEYGQGNLFLDFLAGRFTDSRKLPFRNLHSGAGHLDGGGSLKNDPLKTALESFVTSVRTGMTPLVSARDGYRAVSIALDIITASLSATTPDAQEQEAKRHVATDAIAAQPTNSISLFNINLASPDHRVDAERRIRMVLHHLQYIDGPEVKDLERELAAYAGVNYCLTTSSGTTALMIALLGEDLTTDDAVFLPANTYMATCNAVILAGATPVFTDVSRETRNMSARELRRAIDQVQRQGKLTPRVVLAVDYYGLPAPYHELLPLADEFSMTLIADAAQSFGGSQSGKRVGALAPVTATSFFPTKSLGAFGDGGALFTDDPELFEKCKSIRWHGTDSTKEQSIRVGLNGRLGSIQCAVLLGKLTNFDKEVQHRKAVALRYRAQLEGVVGLPCSRAAWDDHAWGLFTITLENKAQRQDVQEALRSCGIQSKVYPALPLHRQKAFQKYLLDDCQRLENTDWLAERVLSLPLHPLLELCEVDRVSRAVSRAITSVKNQCTERPM